MRTEKVWRRRIGGITSWRLMSGARWTCRIIRSWSHNSSKTFESIRNNLNAGTSGAVRVEAERHRTASYHVWTAALTAEKERFLHCIITSHEKWIHYDNPKRRRSFTTQLCINIGGKVEYPWFEASALHLEG